MGRCVSIGGCAVLAVFLLGCPDAGSIGDGDGNDGTGNGVGGPCETDEFDTCDDDDGNGNEGDSGCERIDLVFSVDPSGSMDEELDAMATDVFPGFASALLDVGGGLQDYRVGVIDACPTPANFHTGGSAGECNFESGESWMTSESSSLNAEFSCVGMIDRQNNCSGQNDDEQPIAAAVASLSSPAIDNANQGFLRDDALLVVVAITDEDECPDHPDCSDTGDSRADGLYSQLVAVKGDVRKTVFLGIGGGLPSGCAPGTYGDADPANLLNKVTNRFTDEGRGVWWDLCAGQLEDGLSEAIAIIDSACRDFPTVD